MSIDEIANLQSLKDLQQLGLSIKNARQILDDAQYARSKYKAMSIDLINQWKLTYPNALIHLALDKDRSLTYLRWRLRERQYSGARVDLTHELVRDAMDELPREVAEDWIRFDELRITINLYHAKLTYEALRLKDYIDRKENTTLLKRRYIKS